MVFKKSQKRIQIDNKYVNEALGNKYKITNVTDTKYYKEIISKILN